MNYEDIIYEKENGIGIMTLNRPEKLNAFSRGMRESMGRAFEDVRRDDDVRVLILTGAGRGFCSGADLSETETGMKEFYRSSRFVAIQPLGFYVLPLKRLEKPVIAAINGVAAGAGCSLILLCDFRIASEKARFTFPFIKRGLIPDCGSTYMLPKIIGTGKALELMLTGRIIDAAEAERIGLVNKVVPHDDLMKEAKAIAQELASAAPIAITLTKRAIFEGLHNEFEAQLYFESYAQNFCFNTEDVKEGIKAFLEKREPKFQGK